MTIQTRNRPDPFSARATIQAPKQIMLAEIKYANAVSIPSVAFGLRVRHREQSIGGPIQPLHCIASVV